MALLDGRGVPPAAAPNAPPPAARTPDPMRWVWRASAGLGMALAVAIYGAFFDRLSETELVELSPLWLSPVVFGLAGGSSRRTRGVGGRLGIAALGAVIALVGLSVFFVAIWPSL